MGFITMLSRETGTIPYGTRIIEQDRINLSVQVDLGNCSQEAYTPTTDVTALSDDVIWFENNFYIPTGVTTFTFTDGTTDMVATLDGTWSFDVDAIDVAYDAGTFTVTNIQPSTITHDSVANKFVAPTGTTAFTFELDDVEVEAEYDTVEAADWAFLLHIASTDGTAAQSWGITKPVGTLKIHWGDGDTTTQTATSHTVNTHTYLEEAPIGEPYRIRLSGNWLDISRLEIQNNTLTGDIDKFSIFRNLTSNFYINSNLFTGSINRLDLIPIGNARVYMQSVYGLTGDVSTFASWNEASYILCETSLATRGFLSGDASTLIALRSNINLNIDYHSEIGLTFSSAAFWNNDGATISMRYCGLSSTDMDNALIAFAGDGTTHVKNSSISLAGNATRTSASDAAVAAITTGRGNTLDIT